MDTETTPVEGWLIPREAMRRLAEHVDADAQEFRALHRHQWVVTGGIGVIVAMLTAILAMGPWLIERSVESALIRHQVLNYTPAPRP